jgi:CHAD domain-containing protein
MAADRNPDFPFLGRLEALVEELHQTLPKALSEWDQDAIHDARVATRRLKAATDLMRFVLSNHHRKPFGKALRKLRKRLGPLRDFDVMLKHLEELTGHPQQAAAAVWLRDHLVACREEARREARKRATPAALLAKLSTWTGVREEVIEAREAVDSLLAESLHLQLDAFAERAGRIAGQGQGAGDSNRRQDPHQLRIAGKLLRYTLELAQAHGHKLPASVLRNFKTMQEALGDWHDDVVLVECAMQTSLDESLAYHDAAMQQNLLLLAQMFAKRAAHELEKFSKLWEQRGGEVAEVIRGQFPLTRTVSGSQTGPGPHGSGAPPAPVALPPDVTSTA